jgi:hypothetical protein
MGGNNKREIDSTGEGAIPGYPMLRDWKDCISTYELLLLIMLMN